MSLLEKNDTMLLPGEEANIISKYHAVYEWIIITETNYTMWIPTTRWHKMGATILSSIYITEFIYLNHDAQLSSINRLCNQVLSYDVNFVWIDIKKKLHLKL